MLNRVWASMQAVSIIALVYSPLLLAFIPNFFQPSIDLGPDSDANEYSEIEIYSFIIDPEEFEEKETPAEKEVQPVPTKKSPTQKQKKIATKKKSKKTPILTTKITKAAQKSFEKVQKIDEESISKKKIEKKTPKRKKRSRSSCKKHKVRFRF